MADFWCKEFLTQDTSGYVARRGPAGIFPRRAECFFGRQAVVVFLGERRGSLVEVAAKKLGNTESIAIFIPDRQIKITLPIPSRQSRKLLAGIRRAR